MKLVFFKNQAYNKTLLLLNYPLCCFMVFLDLNFPVCLKSACTEGMLRVITAVSSNIMRSGVIPCQVLKILARGLVKIGLLENYQCNCFPARQMYVI